jgi:hypothetical protein
MTEWNVLVQFGANVWQFHTPPMARVDETSILGLSPYALALLGTVITMVVAFILSRKQEWTLRLMYLAVIFGMTWFLLFPRMLDRYSYYPLIALLVFVAMVNERTGYRIAIVGMFLGGFNTIAPLLTDPLALLRPLSACFILLTFMILLWGRNVTINAPEQPQRV